MYSSITIFNLVNRAVENCFGVTARTPGEYRLHVIAVMGEVFWTRAWTDIDIDSFAITKEEFERLNRLAGPYGHIIWKAEQACKS